MCAGAAVSGGTVPGWSLGEWGIGRERESLHLIGIRVNGTVSAWT